MQLKHQESCGGAGSLPDAPIESTKLSSSLPFGQIPPLSSLSGPSYVTAQLLVQQVAYKLSDKIFSYSPETFDLHVAAEEWAARDEKNIYGSSAPVIPLQTRTGAGSFALGYIFSPDFDLKKRHIPQTLLAPSAALTQLRQTLDQIALLYSVSSPFVAHVPALGYAANHGVVSEYDQALRLTEDLGLGLVSSASASEAQHMALLATLLATVVPTLHVYDGVRMARETSRVVDTLSEANIAHLYQTIQTRISNLNKHLDATGKTLEVLALLNNELGTDYQPFEYFGAVDAETVLIVFGSTEAQLAKQAVSRLVTEFGSKVGLVNVRLYRPFAEEKFLSVLPNSARNIAVLGQVKEGASFDAGIQSALYTDVLTAISFSGKWAVEPAVSEYKYSPSEVISFEILANIFGQTIMIVDDALSNTEPPASSQFSFWDSDSSSSVTVATTVAKLLARQATTNVYLNETFDNLVQGGVFRADIRTSKQPIEAPYPVANADLIFVGDEKIFKDIDILATAKSGANVILRLPDFKNEEVEKRLAADVRQTIKNKDLNLYALDTAEFGDNAVAVSLVVELAFLKISRPDIADDELFKLLTLSGHLSTKVNDAMTTLGFCFRKVEVPASWSETPAGFVATARPSTIKPSSFVPFVKDEVEPASQLQNWEAVAKAFAFKEAYGTSEALRPDLPVKTMTVTVKENRRLTPTTYDRNIFHIEFDLGASGLTYNIGEALGIHAENDPKAVAAFISDYGLNADDLVQVPSHEDPSILETHTVYQSLVHNIDILGRPPKRFYEALAQFATDAGEKAKLEALGSKEGADEFKKLSEEDAVTYVDVLADFPSARPSFHDLATIISPMKRREYSIASAQAVTPNSVTLMIVVVNWTDARGRLRTGQATRYLGGLAVGSKVTVSVKPSVMKLPVRDDAPLIMAGLGTGLAPFRAFVQYRAMQKAQGKKIGSILLYMGSRHQREEYLYGEEWEAYLDSGVLTIMGAAFSRDQPEKIYIQDRMRQTMKSIRKAYIEDGGSFYLCGPTWPVPDVTAVLEEAIAEDAKLKGIKVNPRNEIEKLREDGRYVLEVY
ncbi:sulfite reductase [NADPH] flavoprotein component [Ceratocystis pirilliformis]|uniref:Sulfite reductase [NADPH] flavoprotein component n=1 Tax=Ceratocystis pirilliformis TaxID=259994 RepID=A0ABR3ZIB3_9PEZI